MTAMSHEPVGTMTPEPYVVCSRVRENDESVTIRLQPLRMRLPGLRPGQFAMLYSFGVGEIPMSFSGDTSGSDVLTFTIRSVGAVSRALSKAPPGTQVGVRGPFGTDWRLDTLTGSDLVVVAGGCGLAPLRPVVLEVLARRHRYGRVVVVIGARTAEQLLFLRQLLAWVNNPLIEVIVTVDTLTADWRGRVGVVTEPVRELDIAADRTAALLCGPEQMMRSAARTLITKGMAPQRILLSLERNMQCGLGWCGHCQLGPLLLCRDGPVVGYDVAGPLLDVEEL